MRFDFKVRVVQTVGKADHRKRADEAAKRVRQRLQSSADNTVSWDVQNSAVLMQLEPWRKVGMGAGEKVSDGSSHRAPGNLRWMSEAQTKVDLIKEVQIGG